MQHEEAIQLTYPATPTSQRSLRDRVGVSLEVANSVDAISWVREAEQAGVHQLWMTGGGAGGTDTLTLFAVIAAQTERVRLGTAIVPTYPRHPVVMAQQTLVLHDIAPGRFRLGIGPSHRHIIEGMYGLSLTAPLAYLREYLEIVRPLLWQGRVEHHGRFFNVATSSPRKAEVPLLISALGPKAFHLGGEVSDGAISWMCPIPYLLEHALPELQAGAKASQRPAPPLVAHVLVAVSSDEAATEATTQQRIGFYSTAPFYAHMFAEAGFPDAAGKDRAALAHALVISGDEAAIQARIKDLLASGLDELLLQLVPVVDEAAERRRLLQVVSTL